MNSQISETEQKIVKSAIRALELETGLCMLVEEWDIVLENQQVDAVVSLEKAGNRFAVEIKKWAQQANIGALIHQIKQLPETGLLVADYINPIMAENLREQQVQFIDGVGNAFINQPPVYVFVKGNRKSEPDYKPVKDGAKRAFEPKGLIVTYAFLCFPELVNKPYREIAEITGVAVGTVGWAIKALIAGGFIHDKGGKNGRHIINYQKLLDRWVEVWPEKLKPKYLTGEFLVDDPYWWKSVDIREYDGYWGGEIAASKYNNNLKPAVATVYLPEHTLSRFLRDARLRKVTRWSDDGATVLIYSPFWTAQLLQYYADIKAGLVHPILVYADLVATGDPRNLEVAKEIYEQYITQYFRED